MDCTDPGVNGGNLKNLLSYRVQRVVNNEAETVEEATTDTSLIDDWTPVDQASAYYTVTALTEAGESEVSASEKFEVGNAYALPYAESFVEGVSQTNPWTVQNVIGTNGDWALFNIGENPYVKPHDDDNGLATFDGYHAWTDGMELRLISPRIDLSKFVDRCLLSICTITMAQPDGGKKIPIQSMSGFRSRFLPTAPISKPFPLPSSSHMPPHRHGRNIPLHSMTTILSARQGSLSEVMVQAVPISILMISRLKVPSSKAPLQKSKTSVSSQ